MDGEDTATRPDDRHASAEVMHRVETRTGAPREPCRLGRDAPRLVPAVDARGYALHGINDVGVGRDERREHERCDAHVARRVLREREQLACRVLLAPPDHTGAEPQEVPRDAHHGDAHER